MPTKTYVNKASPLMLRIPINVLFQNEIPLDGTYVFVYFSFKDLGKSHKKFMLLKK